MLDNSSRATGSCLLRTGALLVLAFGVLLAGSGSPAGAAAVVTAASTAQRGYVLVDNAGATWAFGTATAAGTLAGRPPGAPIVDAASTPTGLGHVMVASDGGVFTFGDAAFRGSLGGIPLNAPIVGIDVTRSGKGYILFAADGGVFTFGDAAFRGSLGSLRLNQPIVDGAFNKANDGYILTAADGGVFAFGNTRFAGSTARTPLNGPIAEIMMADEGFGYALIADDGGIFAYGGFPFFGSLGGIPLNARITDAAPSSTGDGYNLVAADGGVFAFGDAPFAGSLSRVALARPIIAILGLANEPPKAVADTFGATEDTVLTKSAALGVLANDTDDDGDPLTATLVTGPTKGTLALAGNGSFTYTPTANSNGTDFFTYRATDSNGASATARATITVAAVNDGPLAVNDAHVTSEDTPLTVIASGVLTNDTDLDGGPLTVVLVAGPSNGTLALNPNGSFTYTPSANYGGPDSFTYKANDGTADSNVATVSLTVTALNDVPAAVNDAYTTNEDIPLTIAAAGVLANDTDVEGSALTAALVVGPTRGTLTLSSNGSFTYTPDGNANGADSFTYRASDGTGDGNVATVSLTVTGVNDAPVAVNDTYTTNEDTPLTIGAAGVLVNDTDVDGNPLTAVLVAGPTQGALTLNPDGSFTYTPNANFGGVDSFTYKAGDGTTDSSVATVSLTVTAVNDVPVAVGDAYTTNEDTPLTIAAAGLLANDTDVEGSALGAILVAGPSRGTLTLNPNGSFTYTPNANANGPDSFTYRASDGTADSGVATVSLTVTAVNDEPSFTKGTDDVVLEDAETRTATGWATSISAGPPDESSQTVTINRVSTTNEALFSVLPAVTSAGTLTYTAAPSVSGSATVTLRAFDSGGTANGGDNTGPDVTFVITVTAVNDAPVAVNDAYSTGEDTPLTVVPAGVLANDTDVEGSALGAVLVAGPSLGTLTLNPNGSFTYTPNANVNGPDSFTYKASDGTADSNVATVNLTVSAVTDAPVAVNDTYTTNEDTPLATGSAGVLVNDTDGDGNPLTAALVTGPTKGTLTLDPNGSFTYTPNANVNGPDSFTYKANDGSLDSNVATVNLTVTAVNDPPTAVNDSYSTNEDSPLTIPALGVLTNDSDLDGGPLSAVLVAGPTKGSITLNANGSFTYTPNANANGPDSFTYKANDGTADSNVATVTITVNALNDAPVAANDASTTNEDTPLTVTSPGVLTNDTDADAGPLTAALVSGPTNGALTLNSDGSFTYTPAANYGGADSFTYKANDNTADSNIATVNITVIAVNDAPVAVDDAYATNEDTPLVVPAAGVLANDSDAEGSMSATSFGGATNGTIVGNADGSFTFTPTVNHSGAASFSYTVSDGTLTDTGTVNVTVAAVNDAPTAGNNFFLINEDTPFTVTAPGVLANDSDTEGDPLTAIKLSDPTLGVLTFNADGSFTYTPNANAHGVDSFTYKANDGSADSNVATVFVTVDSVNDPPVALDDGPFTTYTDTNLVVAASGVLTNDSDADGQSLTAGNASDPANGTVTLNPDGSFSYTPDSGFNGQDTFTYDVSDGTAIDTATVTINTVPPNATPTADATSASGNEDGGAITVTLTGHDADGDALTFTAGTATNGLVTVPSDVICDGLTPATCTATVTYTPNADFNGSDSFTYTVNDGTIDSAPATTSITVTPVNDSPSFTKGGDQTILEDAGPQTVNGWATAISTGPANESAQTVSFTVTNNSNALFSVQPAVSSNGALTYTPAVNANGSATVTVAAQDDGGTVNGGVNTSPPQTFTITVTAVNDAPSFIKGTDQTPLEDAGGQSITSWATAISDGPANEAAQTVAFEVTGNDNATLFSAGPLVAPTGTLTFTSAANTYGTANVTVRITDDGGTANGGASTSGTQTFVITVTPVNDAPVAAAKAFTAQTNMKISLGGLLTGATDPGDVAGDPAWTPSFTLGSITAGAGCIGCTISNVNNVSGTFDFEPPAGGSGAYTVSYTVVDNGFPAPGLASAAQTITFTVSGPVIWFVDGTSGSDTTGTGTLARPFATLGKAATVDAANHRIFLHQGTFADGITLLSGEWLTGTGAKAASFDVLMGITPPIGTIARPTINGTSPTVNGTVTLGFDNTLRGLTLKGAPALTGASFGTLSLGASASADLVVNSTGQALNLGTGTITGDFVSSTSSGGANNVLLTAVRTTTSTSLGNGILSGATNDGFRISGGDGTFSYSGTVANATGTTVSIVNKIGGTVTFTGAVSDSAGPGVSLASNGGSTIVFSGGVSLSSGSSPAFSATGGGTVTVTGAANTLSSTGGTALTVIGTNIGGSGLTFQSISATGATNGIVLNTTGILAGAGGLSITGSGTTLGSGGTIQATSGDGVSLTNTRDTSLTNLNVTNANGHGIRSSGSTNLTLARVQVAGAGDADNEHGLYLTNQAGTVAISGGTYSDATDNLVLVENSNTNLTLTVNNAAAFRNFLAPAPSANNAIQLVPNGTSAIAATVNGATFTDIKNSSVNIGAAAFGSSGSSSLTFTGTVTSGAGFAGGIVASGQESTTTTLVVNGSTFTTAGGNGVVNSDANDSSTLLATVTNNTFTGPKGHGIVASVDETATTRVRIEGNLISNAGGDGMLLTNYGGTGTSNAHFIVRNNTVNGHSLNPAALFVGGIGIFNLSPENDSDTVCAAVTGNTVTGTPGGQFDIYLQDSATSLSFRFEENPNTAATGAVTEPFIKGLNPGTTLANIVNVDAQYSNGTTCQAP